MTDLTEALKGNFVIANLGAALDADYGLPPEILKSVTLVELDAGERPIPTSESAYHRKITVRAAVAGEKGRRTFHIASHLGNCSLLKADRRVTEYFGIEDLWREVGTREVETTPFPELLQANGVSSLDFLKTDLEGLDFEIIRSCEALLPRMLAVQSELRFRPLYQGETPADEVIGFMSKHGFDLLALNPGYWKPNARNRNEQMDGTLAYVDCIFMRRAETLPAADRALSTAKMVLLCSLLEKRCHGEWLLERSEGALPAEWIQQLKSYVQPASFTKKMKLAMLDGFKASSWARKHLERKYGMNFDHYSPAVFNFHNL